MSTSVQPSPSSGGMSFSKLGERLQQIILGWKGADRHQPVTDLHDECSAAAGPSAHLFLPVRVLLLKNLDAASLRAELSKRNLLRSDTDPRFRVPPPGRFDAVLVPVGPTGQACDRWCMFLDEGLSPRDQRALYAHALGHGLLNVEARGMGKSALPLDPRDGFAHLELLGELRLMENVRQPQDRRVLEGYPTLADLLRSHHDTTATGPVDPSLLDRLGQAGWRKQQLEAPYTYTAGRVYVSNSGIHRGRKLRVDALLRPERSFPVGVAHLLRPDQDEESALAQLDELARERLGLPFAYLVLPGGGIIEMDRSNGGETQRATLTAFPAPDVLLHRWLAALGLDDEKSRNALCFPYEVKRDKPLRYYQELATNRAVAAVLQARLGRRKPRVLITQATGTGKTNVAFQIVWKLKQVKAVNNVLFVTDRDWLLKQALNEFSPLKGCARIRGELRTAQDIFFATYQALAGADGRPALYSRYPKNYFDLILIDECHRGSADDESNWRSILDHFAGAVQIGMTATPLNSDNADSYAYFGEPVAIYSLRQGINDGFLAPYRVRRVLMRGVDEPDPPAGAEAPPSPPAQELTEEERHNLEAVVEASATLRERTRDIARHLAGYLRESGPLAKTIVFCVDIPHAELMMESLRSEMAAEQEAARRKGEEYIDIIVSDDKAALGAFSAVDQEYPAIVTTSRLLSTGVDVPTCKNVVLARPVNSVVEFKQIVGRGTRLFQPQKSWFTIVDYAGATKHFYDEEWDGDPQFVDLDTLVPNDPSPAPPVAPPPVPAPGPEVAPQPAVASDTPAAGNPSTSAVPPVATSPVVPADIPAPTPVVTPPAPGPKPDDPSVATGGAVDDHSGAVPEGSPAPTVGTSPEPPPSVPLTPGDSIPPAPDAVRPGPVAPSPASVVAPGPEVIHPVTVLVPGGEQRVRPRDGRRIAVVGEIVYELGPDGVTMRQVPYVEYAREAIGDDCPTLQALRDRWLNPDLRREMKGRLDDDGVDLAELAEVFKLAECDPLDVLAYALFRTPVPTRQVRVARLRACHAEWFGGFSTGVREILDVILQKFCDGDAPDVNDTGLLKVPPLAGRGTFMELAQRFGGGAGLRSALAELKRRLYEP